MPCGKYITKRCNSPYLNRWAQPDSIIPDQYNPLDWDRYSFVRNNPTRYTDPDGHRPCDEERGCGEPVDEFQLTLGRMFEGEWDPEKQEEYQELFEKYTALLKLIASLLFEPADWIITTGECAEGNCSGWIILGFLPGISGTMADELGEGLICLVRSDQFGTSQIFKTFSREDGLSVFANVLPEEVLKEFPGLLIPNTTVIIPVNGLPPGTNILKTLGEGISEYLANAHYILVRPEGWSNSQFAKFLKQLVGW